MTYSNRVSYPERNTLARVGDRDSGANRCKSRREPKKSGSQGREPEGSPNGWFFVGLDRVYFLGSFFHPADLTIRLSS
jgi:hypothetical protein